MSPLTRRQFLQFAASGAALGVAGGRPLFGHGQSTDEEPLFRFVQWNDIHVEALSEETSNHLQPECTNSFCREATGHIRSRVIQRSARHGTWGSYRPQPCIPVLPSQGQRRNDRAKYLIDWVNRPENASRYDFVVSVGDQIQGGDLASLAADSQEFKLLVRDLKVPLRLAIGNHENKSQEGDPAFEGPFCEALGLKETNYTFSHKGFLFVVLNDSGDPHSKGRPVAQRRNEWFRRVLETSAGVPKIVCCHIPLTAVRDADILTKSFGFTSSSCVVKDEEPLRLVDQHAESIVAVLSGHLHLTGMVRRNGVHHIVLAGTASHPCDFATYDVFGDRIRVRVRSLPKKYLTPRADLYGRPRHKIDYTDAAHPTHESYIRGNASERDFEIPLPKKTAGSRAT
ncbi:MAG TPA: metallophosphoesterase [Thermoguttaceae bacterium]|nr:metallophosphoesterase [Thermoguttaceae bacterium]